MKTRRKNVALAVSIASLVFTLWRITSTADSETILKAIFVTTILLGIAIIMEAE